MATTKIITEVTDLNDASSTNGLKMPTGGAYSGTPTDGMLRNDTTGSSQGSASTMQHFNGIDWKNYENLPNTFTADFLVLAGGGGGGCGSNSGAAGGGGAGGLRTSWPGGSGGGGSSETSLSLSLATPYNVIVGPGGAGGSPSTTGTSGSLTSLSGSDITTIESLGGGGGGTGIYPGTSTTTGLAGGSGGGGAAVCSTSSPGGSGASGQGSAGGAGLTDCSTYGNSGGGGGAAQVGADGSASSGGAGGNGLQVSITGSAIYYAGGGGGVTGGIGGLGGGADSSTTPLPATANTGGGGGGGQGGNVVGSTGGSGIVILRYPTSDVSSYAVTGTLDTTTDTAYPVANTAYYKLNGDALDSSGNGYNGAASNLSPYAAGRFGQAAVFNGSSSIIEYPLKNGFLNTRTTVSVSLWFKCSGLSEAGCLFTDYAFTSLNIDVYIDTSGKIQGATRYSNNTLYVPASTNSYDDNNWHHLVVVIDQSGNTRKHYVDGNLIYTGTLPSGAWNGVATQKITSGRLFVPQDGLYTNNFAGSIDQVRIFDTALSAGNVTSLYNEGTVVESTDGTDSILQFIGGTGTVTFS